MRTEQPPDMAVTGNCKDAASTFPRLLGDIGGTNSRFALQLSPDGEFEHIEVVLSGDFPGPFDAIEYYLAKTGATRPCWAAIGIASSVIGDIVKMTNLNWSFSIQDLRRKLGLERLKVMNDLTAQALSLPMLKPENLRQVGGSVPAEGAPIALIAAGTGLGVSGLVPYPGGYVPLESEGGHVTLAAFNDREAAILSLIRRDYPHVSAERVLSGLGLPILYRAIAELHDVETEDLMPVQITGAALAGTSVVASETVATFCAMLGTVAADLALTLGARGGVYIGGGIVPKLGDYLAASPFRTRFEQKGRFAFYLDDIPVYVIHARYPALIGAAQALQREAAQ